MNARTIKYRKEIDGLRGIAVTLVVLYHYFPDLVPSGFVGVDIFFVISGYLITTIITKEIENKTFSLRDFYTKRVRRLFPALIPVLIFALSAGWFTMTAAEYKDLSIHVAGGSVFASNLISYHQSGYFETLSEYKPLLHLWSLGAEEQFYIAFPLITLLLKKSKKTRSGIIIMLALSFALSIYYSKTNPPASYFLIQSRAWELLAGAALAAYTKTIKRKSNLISAFGLTFIILSSFAIEKTNFPGYQALIPVIGAMCLIARQNNNLIKEKILSNQVIVYIGLVSYPLYLWHWTILSIFKINIGKHPENLTCIYLIATSITLSHFTYKQIEKKARKNKKSILINSLVTAMFLILLLSLTIISKNGLPERSFHKSRAVFAESISRPPAEDFCFDVPNAHKKKESWYCQIGKKEAKVKVFASGDSHALSLVETLDRYGKSRNIQILFAGSSACPPILGIETIRTKEWEDKHNCLLLNKKIYDYIVKEDVSYVLAIARWSYYTGGTTKDHEKQKFKLKQAPPTKKQIKDNEKPKQKIKQALQETINKYSEESVKYIIFEDNPQQKEGPQSALKKHNIILHKINSESVTLDEHKRNQEAFKSILEEIAYKSSINFDKAICDGSICPLADRNGFYYYDDDHLSRHGASKIYHDLGRKLDQIILKDSQSTP